MYFYFLRFGPIVLFRSYASHRVYGVYSNARALGSILGPGASLLFLPHGVRIMATWCFRFQAVIPLFWGEAIAWLIFGATNINLIFLSALVGSLSVLIVFEMFRLANVNLYYGVQIQFTWRLAIVVAFVSSCLNSVGHSFALSLSVPDYDIFLEISKFVIGDVLGTFVTFLFGMQIVRFVRLQKGF